MKYKIFLSLAISLVVFVGCKKKVEPKSNKPVVVKEEGKLVNNLEVKSFQIDATDYNKWVYFSFSKGDVVSVEDPKNDLSWDIAFKRSYVKTNGGTSGKGNASGLESPFKSFSENVLSYMKSLSEKYKEDKIIQIPVDPNQDGQIQYLDESLNEDLNKGVSLEIRQQNAPIVHLSEKVYYFRSADGKYGAIKFTSYAKEIDKAFALKGGYVSFEYQYPFEFTEK